MADKKVEVVHETEYLEFIHVKEEDKPKTKVYTIIAKRTEAVPPECFEYLGRIKWFPSWRGYCFFPMVGYHTTFSDRCLQDISKFINKINAEHKKERGKK